MTSIRTLQSPVVVGRDDVLALMARKTGEAAAGRGQTILIAGEAGIGKSRIVGTVIRQARAAGFRHAKGDINPQDQHVMLLSLADMARTMT
jgi:predicted ATPase